MPTRITLALTYYSLLPSIPKSNALGGPSLAQRDVHESASYSASTEAVRRDGHNTDLSTM